MTDEHHHVRVLEPAPYNWEDHMPWLSPKLPIEVPE